MRQTALMVCGRSFQLGFPPIMHQSALRESLWKFPVDGFTSPIVWMGYESKIWGLPSPKPMLIAIYFYSCFICANYFTVLYTLFYHLVYRSGFLRKPLEQTMDSAFTEGNAKSIVQGLFHSGKRQLLARVKVSHKRFHFFLQCFKASYEYFDFQAMKVQKLKVST